MPPRSHANDCERGTIQVITSYSQLSANDAALLSDEDVARIDAYWRAANYLCVGMIYLLDNPLLREPLRAEHVKNRLLGHFGSDPGQSFIWAHLNRLIVQRDLDVLYV